jgi:hypothetical protein
VTGRTGEWGETRAGFGGTGPSKELGRKREEKRRTAIYETGSLGERGERRSRSRKRRKGQENSGRGRDLIRETRRPRVHDETKKQKRAKGKDELPQTRRPAGEGVARRTREGKGIFSFCKPDCVHRFPLSLFINNSV